MAAQTLTAASNFDGPSLMLGLLNGEAITVNGGALTIDSDVRWNQNAAVFGSITVSATLGGSVLFEGRNVWELPFTASSGNVPTQNALGSNGVTGGTSGATGELLRVWGSGLEPLASGGAMPVSGWVKLRSKTGNFQAGEVVALPGGATITISGAGKRSWLHIVGAEAGAITIPRLADVKWRGEWYELGTTNGADDQTFQFPVADLCPAIWIEKYAGAYAALGEAGLEPWLNAATRWGTATAFVAQDVRGKYFGQVAATGVITIARRSSNACGFKPAPGLKVFVPNLILGNSTSANWAANTINATLATRYDTTTNQGGVFDMDGVCCNWYINLTTPSAVTLRRLGALDSVVWATPASAPVMDTVAVGLSSGTSYSAISVSGSNDGVQMTRVRCVRENQGAPFVATDVYGFGADEVQFELFAATGSTTRTGTSPAAMVLTRCTEIDIQGIALIGAKGNLSACGPGLIRGTQYADNMIGETVTGFAMAAFDLSNCIDVVANGYENYGAIPNVHPYNYLMLASAGSQGCEIANVGTPSAPVNLGSANKCAGVMSVLAVKRMTARRTYVTNNRLEPIAINNNTGVVEAINVWGDPAVAQVIDANDVVARGCKWGVSAAGQTAVYGTHWQDQFTSDTAGAITIAANEPTAATAGQCVTSLAPGSGFTSAGGLSMTTVGDSVTWTMSYAALGHTALASAAPTITGTNVANHAIEFQADTGSGWSTWAALTGANLAAVGAINPATGIRLKVRATVITASASNLLTNIRIDTVTDATSQQIQYPLPGVQTTLVAQVPLTGAEVRVYDLDNLPAGSLGTELAGTESAGTTFAFDAQAGNSVWLQVMAPGFVEYGQQFTVPASNTTLSLILSPELNT